jgi:aryl-alcohol dehydrogenase-like predicted oxidoreductase
MDQAGLMTTSTIPTTQLGKTGPTVGRLALGAMGMSGSYGATDDVDSIPVPI